MPELTFNLKARFDEIIKARQELARLREEMLKTNQHTSKEVVESLTNAFRNKAKRLKT